MNTQDKSQELKALVLEKYDSIARQKEGNTSGSCCTPSGQTLEVCNVMSDDYTSMEGYHKEADLGLGCGLPTQFAMIQAGNVVVDLGSGAGNDCFIARKETGETGRVIGIDFSPAMIERAQKNAATLNYSNVEFIYGDLEAIPLPDNTADVVVSNCVLNLVPSKTLVFSEIYRILKAGGHFSISDIVLEGELPQGLAQDAAMYSGCVAGAIQLGDYLQVIEQAGMRNITIQKKKSIYLPPSMVEAHLNKEEMEAFERGETGIYSVTIYAEKQTI